MNHGRALTIVATLVLASCGVVEPVAQTTTTVSPTTTTGTTKSTTTTAPPTTVTTLPTASTWTVTALEHPVKPDCCDAPVFAPVSPTGEIPVEGWPADGFYSLGVNRLTEPPSTLEVEIKRWVPCAYLPDQCSPNPPRDGVTADRNTAVTRFLDLNDELTVVIWPLWPDDEDGPAALVGSGTDLAELLLNGIDHAFIAWVLYPYQHGVSVDQIGQDLLAHSADPDFPFGTLPDGYLGYRGPLGSYLTATPAQLLETAEPWPPGWNGLYDWWTTLEVRDGQPILYVYANRIAG